MENELQWEYHALNRFEAMKRLFENKDFNELFFEDYMKESLIQLSYNFGAQPSSRNDYAEQITSRTHFRNFIDAVIADGMQAQKVIEQSNQVEEDEYV